MSEEQKQLLENRHLLALDAVDHARRCIKDHRGDLALKALDIAEHQIQHLKPE